MTFSIRSRLACAAWTVALGLVACSGGGSGAPAQVPSSPSPTPGGHPVPPGIAAIAHVVIVVQENRSFDNLFNGFPGADTVSSGLRHDGSKASLVPTSLTVGYDIAHGLRNFLAAYDDGKMDGFDLESAGQPTQPYGYVPQSETVPDWTLASRYVLADHMFASQLDNSFTAHQYLISAQSAGVVDNPGQSPWGCDAPAGTTVPTLTANRTYGPGVFPCFDDLTLGDELDKAGLTWRYYAPPLSEPASGALWTAYDAIRQVRYGPDWAKDMVTPETTFLTDAAAGKLATVSWVIPDLANSDHSGSGSGSGPDWVASVVNAVGQGPDWSNTAIFIVWDDWGGWYDHVVPPQLDAHGLGFRVPMIVVSPYAKSGFVSHTQYEFGSILQFVEGRFGLATLSASDARANPPYDCFDFSQSPRPFSALKTRRSPQGFLFERSSARPPDDD